MTALAVATAGCIVYAGVKTVLARRRPTGEQCEVCGAALTTRTQIEVREDQHGDPAAVEIAEMGGGSFLAAYYCRRHDPARLVG